MTINLTPTARRATSLAGLCDGAVHLPGDPGYDAARMPWNVAVDQRPAAVALPRDGPPRSSRSSAPRPQAGLRVAPQSTGHNAGPLVARGLDDVVVAPHLGHDRRAPSTPARRIARVEGGALWMHATEPAADHGLAALHGSSPDVGIAGYSLGGGIGWYARQLGLATNSLTAVELVTADGEHVRADADAERRALLGAARWRRQLRRRHGPGVPALPHRDGLRRACSSGTATRPSAVLRRVGRLGARARRTRSRRRSAS